MSTLRSSESLESVQQPRKTVLITGGSGSLGSYIAKLVYSHWADVHEVRLFDRVPPHQSLITGITGFAGAQDKPKVSYYPGDVLDPDALLSACVKVNVVIHCAAAVENGSIMVRKRMKKVNIEGTRNIIQACLDCGVRGLILTGSLTQVFATKNKEMKLDESTELSKDTQLLFPYYGGSKNEAERLVLEANGRIGKDWVELRTVSLRCPVMFGENDTNFVPTVLRAAKHCCGYFIPVGYTSATMQSLYFGNAAYAHVLAAQKLMDEDASAAIGGKFYYIGDHTPVCTFIDFQTQFLKPLGYRVLPVVRIPIFLMLLLAYLIEFLAILLAWLRIDFRTNLNRSSVRYLKVSHSYSWKKAREELGYQPLYAHQTALTKSMKYYRQLL